MRQILIILILIEFSTICFAQITQEKSKDENDEYHSKLMDNMLKFGRYKYDFYYCSLKGDEIDKYLNQLREIIDLENNYYPEYRFWFMIDPENSNEPDSNDIIYITAIDYETQEDSIVLNYSECTKEGIRDTLRQLKKMFISKNIDFVRSVENINVEYLKTKYFYPDLNESKTKKYRYRTPNDLLLRNTTSKVFLSIDYFHFQNPVFLPSIFFQIKNGWYFGCQMSEYEFGVNTLNERGNYQKYGFTLLNQEQSKNDITYTSIGVYLRQQNELFNLSSNHSLFIAQRIGIELKSNKLLGIPFSLNIVFPADSSGIPNLPEQYTMLEEHSYLMISYPEYFLPHDFLPQDTISMKLDLGFNYKQYRHQLTPEYGIEVSKLNIFAQVNCYLSFNNILDFDLSFYFSQDYYRMNCTVLIPLSNYNFSLELGVLFPDQENDLLHFGKCTYSSLKLNTSILF